jgi:anti-sigma B factor antagonist
MSVTSEQSGDVVVVNAGPVRLIYPSLSEFSTAVKGEIAKGSRKIVINLAGVEYLDSAAIGCLMDLYRQATAAGATMKLAALQRRVETMLALTGANQFMEIHADAAAAVKSF